MRQYLGLIILAIVAAALAGMYFWMKDNADPDFTGRLYSLDSNDFIKEISLQNSYGKYLFIKADAVWKLKEPGDFHASRLKLSLLENALQDFRVNRKIDSELPEYGLEKPQITVEFTTNRNDKHKIEIGNLAPSKAQIYVKDVNTGDIFITDIGRTAQFDGSLTAYRGKEVFSINQDQISKLTYFKDGKKEIALEYLGPQNWKMTYPYSAPARFLEISEMVVNMRKWTSVGYPESLDGNYEKIGLKNPSEAIEITDATGKTQLIEFGNTEKGMIYARIGSQDDIVKLFDVDVDFSLFTPEQLLFVAPLRTAIENVSSITIESLQKSSTLQINHGQNPVTVTVDGVEISAEAFYSFFVKYIGLSANGFDQQNQPGEEFLRLKTTFLDGSTQSLNLRKRTDTSYFMDFQGENGYYINSDDVDQLVGRWDALLSQVP